MEGKKCWKMEGKKSLKIETFGESIDWKTISTREYSEQILNYNIKYLHIH